MKLTVSKFLTLLFVFLLSASNVQASSTNVGCGEPPETPLPPFDVLLECLDDAHQKLVGCIRANLANGTLTAEAVDRCRATRDADQDACYR